MEAMQTEAFTVTGYLKRKAKVMLSLEGDTASSGSSAKATKEKRERKERTRGNSGKVKVEVPTDILHPELYRALSEWRTAKTREVSMPAYVIMQQKALMGIVNLLPDVALPTSAPVHSLHSKQKKISPVVPGYSLSCIYVRYPEFQARTSPPLSLRNKESLPKLRRRKESARSVPEAIPER